jgi:N,N'-diacetyllegionaminate synthase
MQIGDRQVGLDQPPYIIAEIGVNHDGEVGRALELTDAAADAGADAVKLQFFETDRLMSKAAKLAAYQKNAGETDPIEMLRRLELTIDEMARVVDRAHERGIHAIVTVFSTELVAVAESLAWDAYKSASPDIVNRPLLEALMATGKPMVVSTGASTLDEVVRAVGWLDDAKDRLAVLQCVSCYPAPDSAMDGIGAIQNTIGLATGYSDHTDSVLTGREATNRGAVLLEKHLTYDPNAQGPDHRASLSPEMMRQYIVALDGRSVGRSASHNGSSKRVLDCERDVREVSRQSVVSACDIAPGTTIMRDMLTIKRPGTGILAYGLDTVVGRVATRAIEQDVPMIEEDFE